MKLNQKAFTLIEIMIVVVILGILSSIAIAAIFSYREKANIRLLEMDLSMAYKAAVAFHIDYPDGVVGLDDLKANGYRQSEGVNINVVNGKVEALEITATHPGVLGVYRIDQTGKISKQ
jgi:prepilin-type N-terminal cleavage/methylation domain-containing protein